MFLYILFLLTNKSNNNFYTRTNNIIDVNMNYHEYLSKPINYSAGFDCRYKHDSVKNIKEIKQLQNIYINLNKQKILCLLESSDNSIFEKIETIKKYDILCEDYSPDIFKAGLLDDWDFNI